MSEGLFTQTRDPLEQHNYLCSSALFYEVLLRKPRWEKKNVSNLACQPEHERFVLRWLKAEYELNSTVI